MSIKKRILPLLMILALVPSLMAVPAAAAEVDESKDGIYNLLVAKGYNLYRDGSLSVADNGFPQRYLSSTISSAAWEWNATTVADRIDTFYFTIMASTKPTSVKFKPYATSPAYTATYLGSTSNGAYHQYKLEHYLNLGNVSVQCGWSGGYLGHFGITSFTGIRTTLSESIETIDYVAKEVYATDDLIMQYDTVDSGTNSSLPWIWHKSTKINDHSFDLRVASTLRPSQINLKWLQEIQFNVSSYGDSTFTASLIDKDNNPIADLPVTIVEGERTTVLMQNGFEYPVMNYTVHVDVSNYDLSLYSLQLNSSVGKFTSSWDSGGMVSYYYQMTAILAIPEVYETPWYVAFYRWINESIVTVGDKITSAIDALAGIFGNNGELQQAGDAMSEQADSMQQANDQMNAVDKPELDTDDLLGNFLDFNTGGLTILSSMTSNAFVPQLMVVVFTFALCGYIFFGKKG